MPSIMERLTKEGDILYRVRLRKKGIPDFSVTFDNWDAACKWIRKHEKEYFENPKYFFAWQRDLFYLMQEKRLRVLNHIRRPQPPRRK